MSRITDEQKELAIEALRELGTMVAAAKVCGVSRRTLNVEMLRSAIFKKRILEAREEGRRNIAEEAIEVIKSYAYGQQDGKTDRNRLTAAIVLANAYEAGFRGTTSVQGKIEHDVRVITAVPRPKYEVTVSDVKKLEAPDKPKSMEQVIEGVVIKESDGEVND